MADVALGGQTRSYSTHGFLHLPTSQYGRWAALLVIPSVLALAAFVPALIVVQSTIGSAGWIGVVAISSAVIMWMTGLPAGILAFTAITRDHDRSWAVFVAMAPLVSGIIIIMAQIVMALLGISG